MEVSLTTASEVKAEISLVKEVVIAPLVVGSSAVSFGGSRNFFRIF
jgi:hypothetical protein